MNGKQRTALVIGLGMIVIMGLFPPWTEVTGSVDEHQPLVEVRYHLILVNWLSPYWWSDAKPEREVFVKETLARNSRQLHTGMLLVQWVIVAAGSGIFLVLLADRRKLPPQSNSNK